jgi:hypothetical protein
LANVELVSHEVCNDMLPPMAEPTDAPDADTKAVLDT